MSSHSSLPNPPVFEEAKRLEGQNNWALYKNQVIITLRARSLLGYLDGTITSPAAIQIASPASPAVTLTPPTATTATLLTPFPSSAPTTPNSRTPSADEWEMRDNYAAATVFQNVLSPTSHRIKVTETCAQMWTTLTKKFEYATELSRTMAEEKLKAEKFKDGDNIIKHFERLEALRIEANNVGCDFPDEKYIPVVFQSLPRTGPSWAFAIHVFQKETQLDVILNGLTEIWKYLGQAEDKVDSTALAITAPPTPVAVCKICRKRYHTVANCWARGGGKEGQAPVGWKAPAGLEPTTIRPVVTASVATTSSTPAPYQTPLEVYAYSVVDMTEDTDLDIHGHLLPF